MQFGFQNHPGHPRQNRSTRRFIAQETIALCVSIFYGSGDLKNR
jgi:hypothetical protein